MKKIISLALAASMVAAMGVTAFAAPKTAKTFDVEPTLYASKDGEFIADHDAVIDDAMVGYGKTYAYKVDKAQVKETSKSDLSRYKAYAEWDMGGDGVESVKFENVKFKDGFQYAIVVKTKESLATSTKYISGKVAVANTSTAAKEAFKEDKSHAVVAAELTNTITDFKDAYPDGGVETFEFNTDDVTFTVDVTGQGKLNLGFTADFQSEFAALYPEANLEFYKWKATPTFNRTGELFLYVENTDEKPTFLYEVTADGAKATKAVYDEENEAWVLKTRKLSNFVISDVELGEIAPEVEAPEVPEAPTTPTKPNPGTGR